MTTTVPKNDATDHAIFGCSSGFISRAHRTSQAQNNDKKSTKPNKEAKGRGRRGALGPEAKNN